jgi:cyclic beta-1,2-glucan synthetase
MVWSTMVPKTQIHAVSDKDAQPVMDHGATPEAMRAAGVRLSARLGWLPRVTSSRIFFERCQNLAAAFQQVFKSREFEKLLPGGALAPREEDLLWLRDNRQQLFSGVRQVQSELARLTQLPHVSDRNETMPRVLAVAQEFVIETGGVFSEVNFATFCAGFEEAVPLLFREVGVLVPSLKLVLLEQIAALAKHLVGDDHSTPLKRVTTYIRSQETVSQTSWKEVLEPLIAFDGILREDPAGKYAEMDIESRNVYRESVSRIAQRSDASEIEVAAQALVLARQTAARRVRDPRILQRESHIGYFLVAEGITALHQRVGYHPSFSDRFVRWLRRHPDEFLLLGIALVTFAITTGAVLLLTAASASLVIVLLSLLVVLLPGSQAAVQVMNYLTTNLLPVTTLPKLDFSEGIRDDSRTLVAIPTLLLSEKQVQGLVEALEVRFLGNHDRNLHFAIVSDLPDSDQPAPEDDALVALCAGMIEKLNEKYAGSNFGSFVMLHRHRVYNPRERGWMGWERKRGKLHDLNQLMRGQYDSFPVKAGNVSILPKIRYVITLDSDTELPRGSAHRMVGALAHPLNQAIIDPVNNIVVAGYGILQPRVGVSVKSTSRSRLAAIFAGETGLDPYTRAISDVYQDLYGEATFAGKGIYEVDAMLAVLSHRFPRNALLSHDLIEGAYARVGLATDVMVIEDYPSHYSAYSRRKHRWLRGDWQIAEWLTDTVPDELGRRVRNPISLVSRWKIFDNLRRSLIEPATFVLFLFGWFVMPNPVAWTIAAICILFVPAFFEFIFGVARAVEELSPRMVRDAAGNLFAANFAVLLTLTLLAHQTLVSIDAVVRAIVRRMVTRERLLEWETAAEAELGGRSATIDRYLDWTPILPIVLGLIIWILRPQAFWAAMPVLALWVSSKLFVVWLNASPFEAVPEITGDDTWLLRKSALHIWRYFAEFSNQEHNWLIPDNVEEENRKVTATVSPTNLGLLLNARQVAVELGYLTVPELLDLTHKTLRTAGDLEKYRGHLFNWYDTRSLDPKPPLFVSSVDNGNLVASLWTLSQGLENLLWRPLVSMAFATGALDHLRVLREKRVISKQALSQSERELEGDQWVTFLLNLPDTLLQEARLHLKSGEPADVAWFLTQTELRAQHFRELVQMYEPWRLAEFAPFEKQLASSRKDFGDNVPLERLPDAILRMETCLTEALRAARNGAGGLGERLRVMLAEARERAVRLIADLRETSRQAHIWAETMDFGFLLDKQRLLLSVGYDADSEQLQPYCYGLLATEPRTAFFIAIAKEDIPQECWFRLDRPLASDHGQPVLLSWTGTMFEYLMPSIWMRSYPNTLLDRANLAAVRTQQAYAEKKGIPWGISESASAKRNEAGDYHYEAFGVPALALRRSGAGPEIVSPYSTFLALSVDVKGALTNLRWMSELGWFGPYGFYEAADYTNSRRRLGARRCEVVRSWMAHHMGMSLLALGNFLCGNVVQRWFHSERRVQATELLLQEKPVAQAA